MVAIDVLLSHVKRWLQPLDEALESVPVLLIDNGSVVETNLRRERISIDDVLETARAQFGIEELAQVKYAILERSGSISVIPRDLPWGLRGEEEIAQG